MKSLRTLAFVAAAFSLALFASAGITLEDAVAADDLEAIKAMGPLSCRASPLYGAADEERRQRLATSSSPGVEVRRSERRVDEGRPHPNRACASVQWALGRVSNDVRVTSCSTTCRTTPSSFRDKAACALAYDQVHLTPAQKVHLFEGLIHALDDPKMDVRRIAVTVLQIQTGQDKGFRFAGPPDARARAVEAWRQWLAEYRSQL